MSFIWHNGEWREENACVFGASDRIRLGDGVFDTLLCVDGRSLHADRHYARLLAGADMLGIDFAMDFPKFAAAVEAIIAKNEATNGHYALNAIISRGQGARGLAIPAQIVPEIVLRLSAVPEDFPPVNACLARTVRRNEGSPLSRIKSCNYGDNILAMREAVMRGCNDAVMLNNAGHVACTTMGNIFTVKDGEIYTPPIHAGVLNGLARQILMQRYDVIEATITEEELLGADEVFLTNSIRGMQFFKTLEGRVYCENSLELDKNFHVNS